MKSEQVRGSRFASFFELLILGIANGRVLCFLGLHSWWYKASESETSSFRGKSSIPHDSETVRWCGRCGICQHRFVAIDWRRNPARAYPGPWTQPGAHLAAPWAQNRVTPLGGREM